MNQLPAQIQPHVEARRIQALERYNILDTPPDGAFDRVTSLAARLISVPISIITLVDRDRIWFKSKQGLDVDEIGRDPGLCASAVLQDDPWILTDASVDPRALSNPLVAGEFGLRFYAGVPLRTHDGYNLGTLCVIDKKAREISSDDVANLEDLASVVMDQMELRVAARRAVSQREMLLRELHHRVKNNLQILLSIVSSVERRAKSSETIDFLRSLRGRLLALGSAHDAMQETESLGSGRTGQLLEQIAKTVRSALAADAELETHVEDHEVSNDVLLPLALILNELMTNALKYGLDEGMGKIVVSFRQLKDEYELTVRDFGPGLSRSEPTTKSSGLGFVTGLARQLHGGFEAQSDGGAQCTVRFPA